MPFRAKAFSLHLLVSLCVLTLVLAALHIGWYHWPGWYLVGALKVAAVMAVVDVGLGPLATLVIANPKKPRTEFRHDLSVIAVIQIAALVYGTLTLWNGRPLFYTFSADRLEVVQASAIDDGEIDLARKDNPCIRAFLAQPAGMGLGPPSDGSRRASTNRRVGAADRKRRYRHAPLFQAVGTRRLRLAGAIEADK
ncbi:MAG: hypothetical protein IPI02_16680 [Sterolibacteriaceae bacterium]|nr:hypothetical protein [Sterolibacteriaceae bacterium]